MIIDVISCAHEFDIKIYLQKGEFMSKQIEIFIDKLYRYDRISEPCFIGFPLEKGLVSDLSAISLTDPAKEISLPTQIKATSRYEDGSVRFVFIRFLADIPANKKCRYICEIASASESAVSANANRDAENSDNNPAKRCYNPVTVSEKYDGYEISTIDDATGEAFSYTLKHGSSEIFDNMTHGKRTYEGRQFVGPVLKRGS
jgi:hypothetical protein